MQVYLYYFRAMIKNTQKILDWYGQNHRHLPWRDTNDAYKIWLSEVILQQTRVEQGVSYYEAFVHQYSTVEKLAAASESEILKLWQGLGYYTRARNLHKTAKIVANQFMGRFPSTYKEIIELPGVGPYTAAAISSIVFNEHVAAIDGNVKRVVSRILALKNRIDKPETLRQITKYAQNMIEQTLSPGDFNQAMMELGAVICKPRNPLCQDCPFNDICEARKLNLQNKLPVKKFKIKTRKRFFYYYVFIFECNTILIQRKGKDIWKGLYEFPLIEADNEIKTDDVMYSAQQKWGIDPHAVEKIKISLPYNHVLSHQVIEAIFIIVYLHSVPENIGDILKIDSIDKYPVSRLTEKFLNNKKKIL